MIKIKYYEFTDLMEVWNNDRQVFGGKLSDFEMDDPYNLRRFLSELGLEVKFEEVQDTDFDW